MASSTLRPLSVGGDHSITYPILKSLGHNRPVGLVHIDAHCDTMGEIDGSKFHHGGPFRQAVLAGVLDPERTIQIGIRGPAEAFWGDAVAPGPIMRLATSAMPASSHKERLRMYPLR